MIKLKKILFSLFFVITVIGITTYFTDLSIIDLVYAQDTEEIKPFTTIIDSSYTVSRDGVTRVVHDIKVTNKNPTTYLKQYALKTSYFGLSNIIVNNKGEEIPANIVANESGTSIGITFPDEVVGQGKIRSFTIEYDNHDLASVVGKVLEVHIPKLGDKNTFDKNITKLITPAYFFEPVRVNPTPISTQLKQTLVETTFERQNGESISAIYGSEQIYKMTLRYHLENSTSSPALAQISLPPDTSYQKLHYHAIDPLPQEMKVDPDGNWIATYKVPASSVTVVHLTAEALITLDKNQAIPVTNPSKIHVQQKKYWESNNNDITQRALQYNTPQKIYDHVVNTLSYSRKELTQKNTTRKGAVRAFEEPEDAICQEFTDTFVAISRSAEIPSRRLIGYAYTQNSILRPLSFEGDILHSWPEYYDSEAKSWIPVDPTWGNTTGGIDYFNQFDLNHIVFAINGASSSLPNPAGSYKIQSEDTKDVEVTIGEQFPEIGPQISTNITQKKFLYIPIPGMYEITVTNDTGQAWYNISPEIKSVDEQVKVEFAKKPTIDTILPFQTRKFDVTFFTNTLSLPGESEINLEYKSLNSNEPFYESESRKITSGPSVIKEFQKPEAFIYLGVSAVIIALATGSLLVFKQRWQRTLRRKSKETQK